MSTPRRVALGISCALSVAAWPHAAAAASAGVGDVVRTSGMRTLEGAPAQLESRKALATVLVFFRPGHAYSLETLQSFATCTEDFTAKRVDFAAVVSSDWPAEQVRETVVEAGIRMPVLVDRGDELYGRLGVQVHPDVVVLDDERRLVAHEPFRRVNFCDRVRGKIQYALHEIDRVEMQQTEGPHGVASSAASEPVVSARTFSLGSNEFEEAVPTVTAVLARDREVAAPHDRGDGGAAGEPSPH